MSCPRVIQLAVGNQPPDEHGCGLTEKGCELTDFESYADIIQNSVNLSKAIVRGTRAMHSWHSKAAVNKHLHSAGLINNPHAMPWIDQR